MSQGGTKRQKHRSELLRRLDVLKPGPGDVFVLSLPEEYFTDEAANKAAQEFAAAVMRATKRPVFMTTLGKEKLALYKMQEAARQAAEELEQQKAAAPVIAKPRIHLPTGVKLEGI